MKKLFTFLTLMFCLNANAQIITTIAGDSTRGYSGDGGQATAAELSFPTGVTFDAIGNLYISDMEENVIRKVSTTGIISTFAGNGTYSYSGDGGQATAAELSAPWGLAFDTKGNLYIADTYNSRIRKVNTAGIITTIAGNGVGSYAGDNGVATIAELNSPTGIALDAFGNLYIADANNSRIRMVNAIGVITTIAGSGIYGYSGDGTASTAAELSYPTGVDLDAAGNLYVVDYDNNCIRKVNTSGIITTVVGNGIVGYSGDGGQATSAELRNPYNITIDTEGNLFIADKENNVIRKVDTSGIISTVAGNGTEGYSGDGSFATNAELFQPIGVALDASGNLYIADDNNNRIRRVCNTNCTTIGIEQFGATNNQVNIYPNPTNGNFVIEPSSNTKQTMQVYDVNGKLVLSQSINGKTTVDASSLNEGIYNISIISNEGIVNKRVVIVK